MKSVLLDESVPFDLGRVLSSHGGVDATHVAAIGLKGVSDHDLIDAAVAGGFEVLVSCDQSLPAQQNIAALPIGIVILGTNNWPTIRANVQDIAAAIAAVQPTQAMVVLEGAHRTRYGRTPQGR